MNGKKVFTISDRGRAELNDRLDELADLEQEISDSVRDIAREVKEDVRDTVKSLREELTQMARDVRQGARHEEKQAKHDQRGAWREQKTEWQRQKHEWQRQTGEWKEDWKRIWAGGFTGEGSRAGDARLGQMLAEFVEEVRGDASNAQVSEETLATAQDALYDAARRIREALR